MTKATTAMGMTIQLLDKNGCAVRRKWFSDIDCMKAWLDWQYPTWQKNYTLEIFYDEN